MIKLKDILNEFDSTQEAADYLNKIIDMPIADFVAKFKNIADDPKITAVLKAGKSDNDPTDERMTISSGKISVDQLRPTQNIIGFNESLINILNDRYNSVTSFLNGDTTFKVPVITYNGKYIIDGHHRWSQVFACNPNCKIPVLNIKGSAKPEEILKISHLAVAIDAKGLPLNNAEGINMLEASERDVKTFVVKNIKPEVLKIYIKYIKIVSNPQTLADYIWMNVQKMQNKNYPIPGSPDRSVMPQTDKAANFINTVKSGIVNFINPQGSDVKRENIMKSKHILAENYERFFKTKLRENENIWEIPDNISDVNFEKLLDGLFDLGYAENKSFTVNGDSIEVTDEKLLNDKSAIKLLNSYLDDSDFSGASDFMGYSR